MCRVYADIYNVRYTEHVYLHAYCQYLCAYSGSTENKTPANLASSTGSAAKKLFPDISVPQASHKPNNANYKDIDTDFGALGRSSSMPIRTAADSVFTKPSRGQSFQQALSVYDMSPDTMQRMIEERHRHDHSEQDTFR